MSDTCCYCYALRNGLDARTYAGFTVDPKRRLRQHNHEISGGARSTTSRAGLWSFLFVVALGNGNGGEARRQALSFEWHMKHVPKVAPPSDKSLRGVPRRLICLRWTLSHPKFAHLRRTATVYACDEYIGDVCAYLSDLPEEVRVRPLSEAPF